MAWEFSIKDPPDLAIRGCEDKGGGGMRGFDADSRAYSEADRGPELAR